VEIRNPKLEVRRSLQGISLAGMFWRCLSLADELLAQQAIDASTTF
jgi:hypothetical protein